MILPPISVASATNRFEISCMSVYRRHDQDVDMNPRCFESRLSMVTLCTAVLSSDLRWSVYGQVPGLECSPNAGPLPVVRTCRYTKKMYSQ